MRARRARRGSARPAHRPGGPALAKPPRGRLRPAWLGGYRHECGSLADAECALPPGVAHRDLVLHLVAAHHGSARSTFAGSHQLDPESTARANAACATVRGARRAARGAQVRPAQSRARTLASRLARCAAQGRRHPRLGPRWGSPAVRLWPVDPANPGEVLACAGVAHLAWRAGPGAATGFVRGRDGCVHFAAPDAAWPPVGAAAWTLEPLEGPPHERLRLAGVPLDWWCPWGLNPGMKHLGRPAVGADGAPQPPPRARVVQSVGVAPPPRPRRGRAALPRPPLDVGCARARLEPLRAPRVSVRGPPLGGAARLGRASGLSRRGPPCPGRLPLPPVAPPCPSRATRSRAPPPASRRSPRTAPPPRSPAPTPSFAGPSASTTTPTHTETPCHDPVHARADGRFGHRRTDHSPAAHLGRGPRRARRAPDLPAEPGDRRAPVRYPLPRERDPRRGRVCELDSVASQANRMEAAFTGALADVVPRHVVRAGSFERDLTAAPPPHRRCGDSSDRTGAPASARRSRRSTQVMPRRWPASPPHRSSTERGIRATRAFASRASSHRASARTTSWCSPAVGLLGRLRARRARARRAGVEESRGRGARPHAARRPPGRHSRRRRHRAVGIHRARAASGATAREVGPTCSAPPRPRARGARERRAALSPALGLRACPRRGARVARGARDGRARWRGTSSWRERTSKRGYRSRTSTHASRPRRRAETRRSRCRSTPSPPSRRPGARSARSPQRRPRRFMTSQ